MIAEPFTPVDTNEIRAMADATIFVGPLGEEQIEQLCTVIDSLQVIRRVARAEVRAAEIALMQHVEIGVELYRELVRLDPARFPPTLGYAAPVDSVARLG